MFQALEQFKVIEYYFMLFNTEFFISNAMTVSLILFIFSTILAYIINMKNAILFVKSFVQIIIENLYLFVLDVLKQNVGIKGIIYFPIIFNVFYFIYFINLSGLVGYNLQLTSHIFVTFSLSISMFIGIILIGIVNLKKKFINQFIPKDAPLILFPLLIIIETISYLIRPFTLGIRLFANMFSGHVLLFVIISFVIAIIEKKLIIIKILLLIFPILLLLFIMSLELLIMFLQAYVFIILLSVYLNDSLHAH
jgi:ATP synthase subunit 6